MAWRALLLGRAGGAVDAGARSDTLGGATDDLARLTRSAVLQAHVATPTWRRTRRAHRALTDARIAAQVQVRDARLDALEVAAGLIARAAAIGLLTADEGGQRERDQGEERKHSVHRNRLS
jgi:acyl-CoA reductase-like NAD-dependent aldehyde dehydrogenase